LGGIILPMSGLMRLYIGYNQFNFDTPEYWEQVGLEEFDYIPQDFIPIYRNGNIISIDAGGTVEYNTYVWYTTNYEYIGTTEVPQFTISEPGRFRCDVFNDIADEIPLWSRYLDVFSVSNLPCRERDSLALVEIYEATDGANWTVTWDLSQSLDTWHGVTLSDEGCVDELDLRENGLTGTLPDAVGDMSDMTVLYMHYNDISGQIPANIGNLTNLEIIDLGDNNLEGEIPDEMSNMIRLKELSFPRNELSGEIPTTFWEKADLEVVRIFNNNFTGTLPATIGSLVNVKHFSIGNNNFTGAIPPEIGTRNRTND